MFVAPSAAGVGVRFFGFEHVRTVFSTHHDAQLLPSSGSASGDGTARADEAHAARYGRDLFELHDVAGCGAAIMRPFPTHIRRGRGRRPRFEEDEISG